MDIESMEEPRASSRASRDGRARLIAGARELLAEKGYAGMELRDVAERGKAPRGSIYHHFPGGKRQLAVEAAALEGTETLETIERLLREHGVRATLKGFAKSLRQRAAGQPETLGCPVAAAALARPEDPSLAAAATAAFRSWERPVAEALEGEGVDPRKAESFASLVVSSVEGALLMSRAAGSEAPLDSSLAGLEHALDALLAETSHS